MTIIVLRLCGLNQNATVDNFYLGIQVFMAKLIITEKNSSRGLVFQTRKKAGVAKTQTSDPGNTQGPVTWRISARVLKEML